MRFPSCTVGEVKDTGIIAEGQRPSANPHDEVSLVSFRWSTIPRFSLAKIQNVFEMNSMRMVL
jgi:hypothetical protein